MSLKKVYFDEPLVRVETTKARFPKTCPVCGNPATTIVQMRVASGGSKYIRTGRDPIYSSYQRQRQETPGIETKVLPIQVCENHADPDAGTDRFQSLCIIIDGLLMGFLLFGLLFIGDSISRGRPISFWPILFVGLFVVAMVMTSIAFQPNALAKAVEIVGFDLGMRNVMIAFKSPEYRNEFMEANLMTAELVSWIMKADN